MKLQCLHPLIHMLKEFNYSHQQTQIQITLNLFITKGFHISSPLVFDIPKIIFEAYLFVLITILHNVL